MNNEMQRKYLTSVKRLMRFAQVGMRVCVKPCVRAFAYTRVVVSARV